MTQAERHEFNLICYGCGASVPVGDGFTCMACGEPLSIWSLETPAAEVFAGPPVSMWQYAALLPVHARKHIVSLEEGGTPLVHAPRLAKTLGIGQLLLKNEMANPTGSFKDRQVSVGISHASELGAKTVAVVSSGNVACAAAAYAARAGMRAVLLMHGHAAPDKIALAAAYGGVVVQVDTPSAAAVFDLCVEACVAFGWYHLSTAGLYNPFNVEGAKTISYEIYAQLDHRLPDWIVAPVGGGGLLGGVWRGFLDLVRLGHIRHVPRLAGVQAAGCAPLKKAIDEGTPFLDTLEDPWPNPSTIAGGIADDILFDGHTVLPAIRQTHGAAVAVDDAEILACQAQLARTEGLLCEPTSAVVIPAISQLPDIGPESRVCCILTGSGFKDLRAIAPRGGSSPPHIAPSLDELRNALAATETDVLR